MPRRSASCLTLLPDESAAALACKLACSAARSSCCSTIRVICHSPYMVPTLSARGTNTTSEKKRTTTPTVNFDTRPKRILGLEGRARPVRRSSLRDSTDGWSAPRSRLPGNQGAGTTPSRRRPPEDLSSDCPTHHSMLFAKPGIHGGPDSANRNGPEWEWHP